jgi:hypothetical protein
MQISIFFELKYFLIASSFFSFRQLISKSKHLGDKDFFEFIEIEKL